MNSAMKKSQFLRRIASNLSVECTSICRMCPNKKICFELDECEFKRLQEKLNTVRRKFLSASEQYAEKAEKEAEQDDSSAGH